MCDKNKKSVAVARAANMALTVARQATVGATHWAWAANCAAQFATIVELDNQYCSIREDDADAGTSVTRNAVRVAISAARAASSAAKTASCAAQLAIFAELDKLFDSGSRHAEYAAFLAAIGMELDGDGAYGHFIQGLDYGKATSTIEALFKPVEESVSVCDGTDGNGSDSDSTDGDGTDGEGTDSDHTDNTLDDDGACTSEAEKENKFRAELLGWIANDFDNSKVNSAI